MRRLFDRRLLLAHLAFVLGLTGALVAYRLVQRNVAEDARAEFNRELEVNMGFAREGLLRYVYAVRDVATLAENNTDSWRQLDWRQRLPALRELGYTSDPAQFPDPRARQSQKLARESQQPVGYGDTDCWLFVPVAHGFGYANFQSRELWDDLLRQVQQSQVALQLLAPGELPAETDFQRVVSMTTWGIRWRLLATARPTFAGVTQLNRPGLFLAGGLALTILVSTIAYGLAWRRIRLQQINADLEKRITARTRELTEALSREQELNRLKTQFVSTVSHEFRTPLGIISSSAEILDRYLDRLPPAERRGHLQSIQTSTARMAELMEGVLLFSRAEADRLAFNPQPVDLAALCREMKVECTLTDVPATINGDATLLRHILSNLISNAVKYSNAPVTLTVQGTTIRVTDRGIGIPAADWEKLFTPFHRGGNVENIHGTGLGLFIVKKCVDLHGGTITVESTEGKGTTVTVTL